MRRPLVAGNWKMNGSRESAASLVREISEGLAGVSGVDVIVCPPFVYLDQVCHMAKNSGLTVGAQDVSVHTSGAYTGEVSADMLNDMGVTSVIVGHSERRTYHGETSAEVAEKCLIAVKTGLMAIVCVGETLEQREANETEAVIAEQLDALLASEEGRQALGSSVIAYEPVWAIGTGRTATPQQAQDVHGFIRARIAEHDKELAGKVRILYGGSVKAANAAELFAMPDIDGGLIGGASLIASDFLTICAAAD